MNFTVANHNDAKNSKGFIHYDNVDFKDIPEMATSGYSYSAGAFKNNHRSIKNWIGYEDVLILDIDDKCSIEQAKSVFCKYEFYLITSKSHQKEKNKIVCDRFRIFIKLESTLFDLEIREKFILNIMDRFPFVDISCKDAGRFYFSSPKDALVYYNSGKPIKIIKIDRVEDTKSTKPISYARLDEIFVYSELKECWQNKYGEVLKVDNNISIESKLKGAIKILDNDFYDGNRNDCMFKVCTMLKKDGLAEDFISDFLIKENDKRDSMKFGELMQCIKSAFRTV